MVRKTIPRKTHSIKEAEFQRIHKLSRKKDRKGNKRSALIQQYMLSLGGLWEAQAAWNIDRSRENLAEIRLWEGEIKKIERQDPTFSFKNLVGLR